MTKIASIILAFTLFFSCQENKDKSLTTDNNSDKESLSDRSVIDLSKMGFYRSQLQSDSTFVCVYVNAVENNGDFYSDTLLQMYACKYKLIDNEIKKIKINLLTESECSYMSIDTTSYKQVEIENSPYIYFSYTTSYQGAAIIDHYVVFVLVNMDDLSNYSLVYEGRYKYFKCDDCIDGDFLENDLAKKHPSILAKLKELSKSSKFIYQRTSKDDNMHYHLNYETKWNSDNTANYAYGAGYSEIEAPIWSTHYKTNLFDLNMGEATKNTENDRYVLNTYFRGNIIGFDKNTKLYFPLFIESCVIGCDKEIELFDNDSLRISYTEGGDMEYRISMKDIIFDTKTGD